MKQLRRERSDADVKRTLTELEAAARAGKNVMPSLVECCKAYTTVGEMARVFRDVFGEFQEPGLF